MSDRSRPESDSASRSPRIPEKPSLDGLEERWSSQWEREGTYRFDATRPREAVYSIDTPPPTVSGALHIGHVFSFTQTDIVARFRRMRAKTVFYPIGWDDNGLATERRVQNFYGVRCDPSIPFDESFRPPDKPGKHQIAISRPNFVELCHALTHEDEQAFEDVFRRLGLSVDWSTKYTTISRSSQQTSQLAFLHLVEKGLAYRREAPTLWDVDFKSAVAQAELEDREVPSAFSRVRFQTAGPDRAIEIETTRPELIPACVALVTNPKDEKNAHLIGTTAITPLFGVEVPVVGHPLADPEKGTGVAMVCTFGDLTDVTWWREFSLPTRTIVGRDGRLEPAPFGEEGWESRDPVLARRHYGQIEGLSTPKARERIIEMLRESGDLVGEPRKITHFVNFYEKGERPLEIVSSRQWYVRTMDQRDALIDAGREIAWHPDFMRTRYEAWINGLTGDWNISRQRFYGVPFPVWYPVDGDGNVIDDEPIFANEDALPVDPSSNAPAGFTEDQRAKPGGFVADPDVMDTWATSSLTPQIAGRWIEDPAFFARVFPMDLRPQAHDIIRTWLFATVVRSEAEHGTTPWSDVAISGFIRDPDRRKLSKSKGNAVVPTDFFDAHGTDAVRYWAGSGRLGVDLILDEQQMRIGRRLAIKLLNATRFVLERVGDQSDADRDVIDALDLSMLSNLEDVVALATESLTNYDHARALDGAEQFFWTFCDDYLELVKSRAYGNDAGARSARNALSFALDIQLRLFAPFLPFVTEETWSWSHEGSIHLASWPSAGEFSFDRGDQRTLSDVGSVLAAIRRAKSDAKTSMRAPVSLVGVSGPDDAIARISSAGGDLKAAGAVEELALEARGDSIETSVVLAPNEKAS
ncbi:MAG: valine--tRNA ligase [Acidimicrobiales bacterium]